ncbi:uncharacterized protein LOC129251364 [Anastrepha obliqua]|uniref:uncharacterized protein LOC129251364 n=1 Tax=Anastrepha obliqua TaxID=95512 RepID=UPI002409A172|nr:uncharacterized protein LOC129251364 [Anastrepha obliqua]
MSRDSFAFLCNEVMSIAKTDTTYRKCIPLDKRVAIALYALASSAEHRTIGRLLGVSKGSVWVWDKLAPKYLPSRFPTQEKVEECVEGFEKIGFPQCLAAVDGCHIEIRLSSDAVDYYNYKSWYSMVLFALVDYR